ncbi:hypothetical protein TPSD3_02600 [Thioflexithrix psekupsensis]|uniref:D-(-)-3-hydroxybutyrate oligomer hydrolase n=2 Tax=Thioflexithrix psekupsensis TaxID=1570016 RepID=A0A251XBI7_9GAMM|nr:hypothetical protein TPSD3_02600 [Thioflexithrix psekupsensis]
MLPFKKIFIRLPVVIGLSVTLTACAEGAAVVVGIIAALAGVAAVSGGGGGGDGDSTPTTPKPPAPSKLYPVPESVIKTLTVQTYDGNTDDLLTAGFGQTGLGNARPVAVDAQNPTAAELRRITIVEQFKAFQDLRPQSGFGSFYGPAVASRSVVPRNDGRVAGKEYLAYYDDGSQVQNVVVMLQIPNTFNVNSACLVAAPAPESRGVYGAIATVGEWGLKHNCAVVYTDKGAGTGLHDFTSDTVNVLDGTRTTSSNARENAHFRARGTEQSDLSSYHSRYPARVAYKHAHSQQNPESQWGRDVLNSLNFAFYTLNLTENYGQTTTLTPNNTLVLAAGWGTGGAAALHAVEQDTQGWIDGVVAVAPLITPATLAETQSVSLQQNVFEFEEVQKEEPITAETLQRPFFDVLTYLNLYQPCASALATGLPAAAGRCRILAQQDLLDDAPLAQQVNTARELLISYGMLPSATALAPYYYQNQYYASLAYTYASAYGRFSVVENLCDYSLGATQGVNTPTALRIADRARFFSHSNGIILPDYLSLINNLGNSNLGIDHRYSENSQGIQDDFYQGALCLRNLWTGTTGIHKPLNPSLISGETGFLLSGNAAVRANRVQNGQAAVTATANLRGKPTLIVQGRDDPLANANFHARAYYARNQVTRAGADNLIYLEIKNAHHFDGYNQQYGLINQVPLQYYFNAALDSLLDHLKNRRALPRSQVVATSPPNATGGRINTAHLPALNAASNCDITYRNRVLTIPECTGFGDPSRFEDM